MKLTTDEASQKRDRFSELLLGWYRQAHEPTGCLDEAIAFLLAQEYRKFEWAKLRIYLRENCFPCSSPNRYFLETYIR